MNAITPAMEARQTVVPSSGLDRVPPTAIGPQAAGEDTRGYNGPKDGLTHPKPRWLTRPVNRLITAGLYRIEVDGAERFPHSGPQVYCPTHQNMFDAQLIGLLTKRDVRYMAAISSFKGIIGTLMTWGGAFPVDRDNPSPHSLKHALELLQEGKGLCLFPEGRFAPEEENGHVGPIKTGAARIAIAGGAESVVPIAIDYQPNARARWTERIAGLAAAAGLACWGTSIALTGGAQAHLLVTALSAALTGGYIGGKLAGDRVANVPRVQSSETPRASTENPHHYAADTAWYNPVPAYLARVTGAAIWGAAGGVIAGLGAWLAGDLAPAVTTVTTAAGVAAIYRIARAWENRDVARILIAEPLKVSEYKERHRNKKAATSALTLDLHRALGRAKESLTGVPYDETVQTLEGAV